MPAKLTIGVSLKLYFSHTRTLEYSRALAEAVTSRGGADDVDLFVIPSFTALAPVTEILRPAGIWTGAQDVYWEDAGPFTGEVSPAVLAELGVRFVEIGHAERRALFGETDEDVARKVAAALRNGLIPLICVGESADDQAVAADVCSAQVDSALALAIAAGHSGEYVVAYEPVWAIGAAEPAPAEHIRTVCAALGARAHETRHGLSGRVIYGGTAGPGLFTDVGDRVDGLFLGRRAHDPAAFLDVVAEARATR